MRIRVDWNNIRSRRIYLINAIQSDTYTPNQFLEAKEKKKTLWFSFVEMDNIQYDK